MSHYGDITVEGRSRDSGELVARRLRLVSFSPAAPGMQLRVAYPLDVQQVSADLLAAHKGGIHCRTADPRINVYRWKDNEMLNYMCAIAAPADGVTEGYPGLWVSIEWEVSDYPVVAVAVHELDGKDGPTRVALPFRSAPGSRLAADQYGAAEFTRVRLENFVWTGLVPEGATASKSTLGWVAPLADSEHARSRWARQMGMEPLP